jgi:hypothetical protein
MEYLPVACVRLPRRAPIAPRVSRLNCTASSGRPVLASRTLPDTEPVWAAVGTAAQKIMATRAVCGTTLPKTLAFIGCVLSELGRCTGCIASRDGESKRPAPALTLNFGSPRR